MGGYRTRRWRFLIQLHRGRSVSSTMLMTLEGKAKGRMEMIPGQEAKTETDDCIG